MTNRISVSNPTQPVISVTDEGGVLVTVNYQNSTGGGGGTGDVVGPASSTDNAIARYDGTTGKLIQDSGITIADGATGTLAGSNSGDVTLGASVTDVLAVTGQSISGVDQGADRLVFWDESENKLTALTAGSGLSISGTTITATATGDVVGPASSTDNALVRFDSTTGKLIQNGQITESDTGDLAAVNSIAMDTTPSGSLTTQGQMMWNLDEETLDIQLNGFALHVGEQVVYHVRNSTGSTIAKGVPVMYAGTTGNSGRLLIEPWDGVGPATLFMGLLAETLTNGSEGFVIAFGKLRGIQTNGANYGQTWTDGEIIYAGLTSGSLTDTVPSAPNPIVQVLAVVHAHASNGTVFIRPNYTTGDVFGPSSATDGNVAVYDGTTGKVIKNGPAISAGGNGAADDGKLAAFDASGGLNAAVFTSLGASSSVVLDENGFRYTDTSDGSYSWLGNSGVILNDGTNTGTLLPPTSANADVNMPSTTGTLVSTGDTGTVTNTMLANSAITINGTPVSLGGSTTIATGITIGSTAITGGTSGRLLTSGTTVGEQTLGTGVATTLAVNVGSAGALVANGGALGTPSSGALTNCSGLPISGLTPSTSAALGVGSIELGNATDTTIARVSAGVASIEGATIATLSTAQTWTAVQTFSSAPVITTITGGFGGLGGLIITNNNTGGTYLGSTSYAPGVTVGSAALLGFSSGAPTAGPDTILARDGAGILAQRNGTNAQTLRVYNTFTSSTNHERATISWATNILNIGTEKGSGGGTARSMRLVTDATARAVFEATTFNTTLLASAGSYGSGSGVLFLGNATTAPTTDPTGGGILYVEAGALKFRGSSGTVTTIANA